MSFNIGKTVSKRLEDSMSNGDMLTSLAFENQRCVVERNFFKDTGK